MWMAELILSKEQLIVHTTIINPIDNDCQGNYHVRMNTSHKHGGVLDAAVLRPSGAMLATQIALGGALEREAIDGTGHDPTTLDLLVRLELAPDRRLRAVELCEQLQLSASHISRTLDRAEASGLIERAPDPEDRRAKTVRLTGAGREVVDDFAPRLHAVLDKCIHQVLDRDEVDVLVSLLHRIGSAAQSCKSNDE
jgi:DNA-binding MarR family transcriptional regulator